MLNAFFGSEARAKILNLLLLHPEQKYSRRQITSDLGLPVNSVRRELENMLKFAILTAEKNGSAPGGNRAKGQKILYSANQQFVLYPEIKALFVKAQILSSQKFLSGLQKISRIKFLALTGLFTNSPESPTDLLIVGSVRRGSFTKLIKELEKDLKREINYTIMNEKEFLYRREIMDIFLYNILTGKTVIIFDSLGDRSKHK
jgi:hypothetical protein